MKDAVTDAHKKEMLTFIHWFLQTRGSQVKTFEHLSELSFFPQE